MIIKTKRNRKTKKQSSLFSEYYIFQNKKKEITVHEDTYTETTHTHSNVIKSLRKYTAKTVTNLISLVSGRTQYRNF